MASVRTQRSLFSLTSSAAADRCRAELFFFSSSLHVQWQRAPVDQPAICAGTDLSALFLLRILVHLAPSVFHLSSSTSSAFRTCWARPLHLSVPVAAPWSWHSCRVCCCQGTEKKERKKQREGEKKNPVCCWRQTADGWHWAPGRRGQSHGAENWLITSTGSGWDQRRAQLTVWTQICSVFNQTADLAQLHSDSVNTASSYSTLLLQKQLFYVCTILGLIMFSQTKIEIAGLYEFSHSGKTLCLISWRSCR